MPGERKNLLGEALSAVREAIRDNEVGSAYPAFPSRFRTCTAKARTKKPRPRRNRAVNSGQRSHNFPIGVSDLLFGRVGQLKAVEVLEIAYGVAPDFALSEHGPCFVEGTVTLDDVSFTMKIAYISRAILRPQDTGEHWQSGDPQCTSPAVA